MCFEMNSYFYMSTLCHLWFKQNHTSLDELLAGVPGGRKDCVSWPTRLGLKLNNFHSGHSQVLRDYNCLPVSNFHFLSASHK